MMCNHVLFRWLLAGIVVGGGLLAASGSAAQEKKDEPKEKKGTLVGVVVEKGKNSIKVKAFGEEKAREYFPKWVGGLPKDGGGLDKKILTIYDKLKIGTKIRLTWEYQERFRAAEIEIL